MRNIVIFTIVILPFLAGSIWLQIFLSKRENKWLGLIIPLIFLIFSIIPIIGISLNETPDIISVLASVVPIFLVFNIPTLVFVTIYYACREKARLRNELDKMNIQDLE